MDLVWFLLLPLLVLATLWLVALLVLAINRRRIPPPCSFVQVEGIRLHYCEKGEGRPVVMVHGSNGSLQDFRLSILEPLSHRFRALAFDRPGHGLSQRAPGQQVSCAAHGEMLRQAWKEIGVDRPILVGHSSAGAVLMDLAVRHPQDLSGIVLISGVVHAFEGERVPVMGIFRSLRRKVAGPLLLYTLIIPFGGLLGRWLLKFTFSPDPVPPDYRRIGLALALRPSALRAEAEDLECLSPTLREVQGRYGELRMPVAIVVGDRDKNVPPEEESLRLHSELAGSRLVLLRETGHMPMFTKRAEVVEAITWVASSSERAKGAQD